MYCNIVATALRVCVAAIRSDSLMRARTGSLPSPRYQVGLQAGARHSSPVTGSRAPRHATTHHTTLNQTKPSHTTTTPHHTKPHRTNKVGSAVRLEFVRARPARLTKQCRAGESVASVVGTGMGEGAKQRRLGGRWQTGRPRHAALTTSIAQTGHRSYSDFIWSACLSGLPQFV